MSAVFYIWAINVHQGGGRVLLESILNIKYEGKVVALIDERMPLKNIISETIEIIKIKPTIYERLRAEYILKKMVKKIDTILCFGNLPPLFSLSGKVILYLQNRYLVENFSLVAFPLKIAIRISIERIWFRSRLCLVNEIIVQTPSMENRIGEMINKLKIEDNLEIKTIAFVPHNYIKDHPQSQNNKLQKKFNFIYVASGEPHKNHRRLIEAWILLAKENHFPTLVLTVDTGVHYDLCNWLELMKIKYSLEIENMGNLDAQAVQDLLNDSQALIFPSLMESFGLPLIEARNLNMPILASELDYVRDILNPNQSFDPFSEISIARAVKRFCDFPQNNLRIINAEKFINEISVKTSN